MRVNVSTTFDLALTAFIMQTWYHSHTGVTRSETGKRHDMSQSKF